MFELISAYRKDCEFMRFLLKRYAVVSLVFVFSVVFTSPLSFAQNLISPADDEFLEMVSQKAFDFFSYEADPATGLVADRAHNYKRGGTKAAASIAATGFGLTAYGIAARRGWMSEGMAKERVRRTLDFFLNDAPHEHGFFYHFMNPRTGQRSSNSELSPIDTALLLAGVLFVGEYFEDPEIAQMARAIYERVDWPWMMNGRDTLALSWSPESGFSKYSWDHYDESMILYLLAIGSPTHPIPAETWKKIARPVGSYGGYPVIQMPPLFTHQYSHAWIDFRNKNDGFADYFQNSINATLANRQFCIDQSSKFSTYGPNSWGLTASDGPFGYRAYGAPPGWADHDGTVAPTACGGSIVFTPEESLACLKHFYEMHEDRLWGLYGFSDSFNLKRDWFASDVIGIDQGTILLMIENYRSELIWKTMNKNPFLQKALKDVGFVEGTKETPFPDPPQFMAPYVERGVKVDGYLKDWSGAEAIRLTREHKELGNIKDEKDVQADVRFAWSDQGLYFSAVVLDDSVILRRSGQRIWMDDLVEIYVDPQGDGLHWEDDSDFQIGFRPQKDSDEVKVWSWFQGKDQPTGNMIAAKGFMHEKGYMIEGGIRWKYLGINPFQTKKVKVSVAIHDVDKDGSEAKLQWFFRNEDGFKRFNLGDIVLTKDTV